MRKLLLSFVSLSLLLSSCKKEEDPNKIAVLKDLQSELIKDCNRLEAQLKVKFQGNRSMEEYLKISNDLNKLVFAQIDTTLSSANTFDAVKFNEEYRKVILDQRKAVKHSIYLKEDSIAIFSTEFKQPVIPGNASVLDRLLNNVHLLNQHLKVLRINNEASIFGCWLSIIPEGYGSSNVYETADSTKITIAYTSARSIFLITDIEFIALLDQTESPVKGITQTMDPDRTIRINSAKLRKGHYYARLKYRLTKETGDSRIDEVNLPITIWQ